MEQGGIQRTPFPEVQINGWAYYAVGGKYYPSVAMAWMAYEEILQRNRDRYTRSRMNWIPAILLIWQGIGAGLLGVASWMQRFDATASDALSGWMYVILGLSTVPMLWLWKKRPFFQHVLFARRRRAGWKQVLLWLLLLLAIQGAADLFQRLTEPLRSLFETTEDSVLQNSVPMLIYMAAIAPVTEELLFRGGVMRTLQPYGRRFAVASTALLFGLFHGNLTQAVFAAAVGLLLGYVAMEYSVFWSIALHFINNAGLALGLGWLSEGWPEIAQWLLTAGLFYLPLLAALVLGIVYRKRLPAWRRQDPIDPKWRRMLFSRPCMIVLIVLMSLSILISFFFAGI